MEGEYRALSLLIIQYNDAGYEPCTVNRSVPWVVSCQPQTFNGSSLQASQETKLVRQNKACRIQNRDSQDGINYNSLIMLRLLNKVLQNLIMPTRYLMLFRAGALYKSVVF